MAQKQQLVALGARDFQLTAAVRTGALVRVRNGWYSFLREDDPGLRAVRVGGRLTGISALVALGAWVLDEHPLHVSVRSNAARLRTQQNRHKRIDVRATRGVELHWDDRELSGRGSATSVGLLDAVKRVLLDEDFETAVAVLDWALHTAALDDSDLVHLTRDLPAERAGIMEWTDARCESLPESLARTRLALAGHEVVSQVRLDSAKGTRQRIDLVVDGGVGLEVDGKEHHSDRFYPDREKDIDITLAHLHAMRPSALSVFRDWDRVALAICTALADRGIVLENSGHPSRDVFRRPGMTGWRRRPPRRSPEFSNIGWGSGARSNPRE